MSTKSPGAQRHEIDWLTPLTRNVLFLAQLEAAQRGAAHVQPEHLILAVIVQGDSKAATLLERSGLYPATLRAHIESIYGSSAPLKETNIPLSQAAKECVECAIAMIAYYLTRHRHAMKVTPDHLVLSIASHPSIRKLLIAYPEKIISLRHYLKADMEPGFLRYVEDLLLFHDRIRDIDQKLISFTLRNKEQANKSPSVSPSKCPACLQLVQGYWKHCAYCGVDLTRRCNTCGALFPNVKSARFCIECGGSISS
jgi:hypothetical protein